jgi:FKBP-type peptidyl-prolyl cis-trans isomerase
LTAQGDSFFAVGNLYFPVSGVIPGWTEALPLMEEGAKWQLFIPPKLAYGEPGAGGLIGPNATLIFEIELLGLEEGKAPAPGLPKGHPKI